MSVRAKRHESSADQETEVGSFRSTVTKTRRCYCIDGIPAGSETATVVLACDKVINKFLSASVVSRNALRNITRDSVATEVLVFVNLIPVWFIGYVNWYRKFCIWKNN